MTEPKKEAIEAMSECGLRPMESYRYMSTETGGDDCVGHTMIDHLNYCYKLKMKQVDGKDSQTLVNKLYDIQSIDPEFFFRVRLNAEGKVECLFWRDSMMREDYKIYGDVLVFDTTFRTNKYNLICAPFVGINNHWKNTIYYNLILKGHKIAKARKFIEEKFKTDNKAVDEIIKKEEERKAKEEVAKIAEQEKAKAEAQRQTQDEESTNSEITIVLDPDRANTKGKILTI
ncbi:protein FAR1-RELATED SEQUENCE 5-like [Spinacia oleracea]|uniref:Protein FAR1-RELATED SEQUENCE 5-like n=1 Tax=Spinacia oleracea TaxID=3562 RepID=A0ABM3R907_SPIOL|nr:protein FAR1-RELATED SEQUENCE 5-like [Spinacia oleracea]